MYVKARQLHQQSTASRTPAVVGFGFEPARDTEEPWLQSLAVVWCDTAYKFPGIPAVTLVAGVRHSAV